jgi:hypothetical protein
MNAPKQWTAMVESLPNEANKGVSAPINVKNQKNTGPGPDA